MSKAQRGGSTHHFGSCRPGRLVRDEGYRAALDLKGDRKKELTIVRNFKCIIQGLYNIREIRAGRKFGNDMEDVHNSHGGWNPHDSERPL